MGRTTRAVNVSLLILTLVAAILQNHLHRSSTTPHSRNKVLDKLAQTKAMWWRSEHKKWVFAFLLTLFYNCEFDKDRRIKVFFWFDIVSLLTPESSHPLPPRPHSPACLPTLRARPRRCYQHQIFHSLLIPLTLLRTIQISGPI